MKYDYSNDNLGRVVTSNIVNLLEQGLIKEAKVSATSFIRKYVREDGFTRKIITPIPIADDQLDKSVNTDKPRKIVELQPDSKATYVSFRGMSPARYFTGKAYEIVFGKIMSDRFVKNIYELKTYDNDIRKIIADQCNKDIYTEEDGAFISQVNQIVDANPAAQHIQLSGGITSKNVAEALKALPRLKKPIGCLLFNTIFAKDILKWPDTYVGDAAVTDQYYNGLTSGKLFGIRTITTIKREIVPDNVMYIFSTEDYLGKFFTLTEPTVYMDLKADMLTFWVYEVIGIGIGNTEAVIKVTFLN